MTMNVIIHFRSGRVWTLPVPPTDIATPEEFVSLLSKQMPKDTMTFAIGPNLVFLREIELMEFTA